MTTLVSGEMPKARCPECRRIVTIVHRPDGYVFRRHRDRNGEPCDMSLIEVDDEDLVR